ncbi:formimidoylglutamate deiminase [Hyphobacterium sp. HN65]|uniref:Formimidoylglutamate deiminase n=1 Tax=Hyphobacterium lacteum TaxID=3116575 RepID=A0ABU7LMD1_9PROT|nr:formimidoylglutamate deiminase [Hyphobacterium sp. HN65]MEE2525082.1 formimidoylglutamate deiminase [Hyphobacterium sp. HN65]
MRKLHAKSALLPEGWAKDVLISLDADGRIASVTANQAPGADADTVAILLPALSNLHSHAFQRALAGLTEKRGAGDDDFWSWREAMYAFLPKLGPDEVEAIAAMLYAELAESGFASVAEFHYLHHQPDGTPFADLAEMAGRIVAAAQSTGLGLTLLPVAYARSGFGGAAVHDGQKRFANTPDRLLALREAARPHLTRVDDGLGLAPHSLRAVTPEDLAVLLEAATDGPIHIHIAEQIKEVDDCLAWSGQRPVEWLLENAEIDGRWCLIHATHMTSEETRRLAASGAVAGLCPTTEADLGDGIFPGSAYMSSGGVWGVGTDSHVRTDAAEELRLLEWSQRLSHRKRTVLAEAGQSNGTALLRQALAGGAQAMGRTSGRIAKGYWADLVSLDQGHTVLCGKTGDQILDSWIFSGDRTCVQHVWSAGRAIVRDGRHKDREAIANTFGRTMKKLLI